MSSSSLNAPKFSEISNTKISVNLVYVSSKKCGSAPPDSAMFPLARLAYTSGGNVIFTDSENLTKYLHAYLPTVYSKSILANPTLHSNFACPVNKDWHVQVDSNTASFFVATTSTFGSVGVIDPKDRIIMPTVLYKVGRTKLYRINSSNSSGVYTLSLASPGACYAHVYTGNKAKVFASFALTSPNDSNGSHNDGEFLSPCRGVANIATFHLHAAHVKESLLFVEGYNPETNLKLFHSELHRRINCSFEYYSAPFVCNTETLGLAVHGVDEAGQPFKRQEIFFCRTRTIEVSTTAATNKPPTIASSSSKAVSTKASTSPSTKPITKPPSKPTTRPPTKSTTNSRPSTNHPLASSTKPTAGTTAAPSSLRFDVVFLVDVSQDAKDLLNDMIKFAGSLMSAFEVSQDNARAAVVSVGALDSNAIGSLNAISSQEMLDQYLKMLFQYDEFDEQGQDIVGALRITVFDDFLKSGYRKDINNHLIIYVTATTNFNEDPQAVAQKILSDGTYGIVTVGYGPQATDKKALQRISGGEKCTFSANNKDSLYGHAPAIQALIKEASSNEGKYCGI
ncbi:hypothetical protein Y032_0235g3175 [Ancylostoma ceylanicum]|uniref:VWFA domain-containing protein n=1 Tax=Ancylostoma ceylanicum TaxID=53326 RepID=A0A016SFH7_9BILA|nr:hypothetical protein Y032_0235g3175 [Ancylostoma ceylanicum]